MKLPQFLNSKWIEKASKYIGKPQKMKFLLAQLGAYIYKEGLSSVKENLLMMYHYLYDIVTGKYQAYNKQKLLIITGVLIYVITPFDLIPDILPTGLFDDSSLILWAIKEVSDELENYKLHTKQPD